jgi:hypothetical protein
MSAVRATFRFAKGGMIMKCLAALVMALDMRSLKRIVLSAVVTIFMCFGVSFQARADTLNITGSFNISPTGVDFLPVGAGTGTFTVDPFTQTGVFVPLAGTIGSASDFTFATAPINQPILLANFLTFAANPLLRLDLTFINLGVFGQANCFAAPAAGQSCSPSFPALVTPANPAGVSPFNLSNITSTSSTLSFAVAGNLVNTVTGESTPFTGTFSTQFTGQNYQQILATWAAGGFATATYSGNFVTGSNPIPEPGTMLLLSSGLIGIAARIRGRRKHSAISAGSNEHR